MSVYDDKALPDQLGRIFRRGQVVRFDAGERRGGTLEGVVRKALRETVRVDVSGTKWRVPPSLLELVNPAPPAMSATT